MGEDDLSFDAGDTDINTADTADDVSADVPEDAPDDVSEDVSDDAGTDDVSDSGDVPDDIEEDTPEDTGDSADDAGGDDSVEAEDGPDDLSEDVPEDDGDADAPESDELPEDTDSEESGADVSDDISDDVPEDVADSEDTEPESDECPDDIAEDTDEPADDAAPEDDAEAADDAAEPETDDAADDAAEPETDDAADDAAEPETDDAADENAPDAEDKPVDDGTDWDRTSLRPEEEAQLRDMDANGEIDTPTENPDWQEPERKDPHLPTDNTGSFEGERGNSEFYPDDQAALDKMGEYGRDSVEYKDGHPDFSPFTKHDTPYGEMDGQVEIPHMTADRENPTYEFGRRPAGAGHDPNYDLGNFAQADNALAEKMGNMTPEQVQQFRESNNLTWHECPDGKTMQLVPREIHDACRHSGGVSEMKYRQAMGDITAPF